MNPISVNPLDPLALPFNGSSLIEASAGTGKTYTISGLYLRLLLGHGGQAALTCEQILVVTFTNAATEELRDRIRKRIQGAFKRFIGMPTSDDFIEQLYQQTPTNERNSALKRFDLALKTLDEAAIYTIHGFCQRVLSDMAFESSLLFESEFTLDDSEYLHHAVRDFWREACYPLPNLMAEIVSKHVDQPDKLASKLRPLLGASQAQLSITPADFIKVSEQLMQSLQRLQMRWQSEQQSTFEMLNSLPLNGQRFGKKADGYPKLIALFEDMSQWASHGKGLPPKKALEHLALSDLKLNKGGEVPSAQQAPLLDHIDRLLEQIEQVIPAFLVRAQAGIKARFTEQKQQRNLMTPDDLMVTLADALTQQSESLPRAIAKRFPIALIDEFQDTDPLQFMIFNQIYQASPALTPQALSAQDLTPQALTAQALTAQTRSNEDVAEVAAEQQPVSASSAIGLLMIGDPKQAIYAFRGADIFTYISARKQTQAHYNLDTNYRSSQRLVAGVNALFSHHDDPFISDAIPFESVATPPSAANKVLAEPVDNPAALHLRILPECPDSGLNKTTAMTQLAEDAANEIARLLNAATQGQCTLGTQDASDGSSTELKAKDIAVLVRNRHEAAVIKEALSQRHIGAVFLSRDSVFNTIEAHELTLVLYALANPKDERKLRSALATQLLGYSAAQIHQFNQDETIRQRLLEQFMQWHELWLHRGIMPALLKVASDTLLVERMLNSVSEQADASPSPDVLNQSLFRGDDEEYEPSQASGERRLTDFRHLAELLQQKATELDGTSALINWFEQQLIDENSTDEQQLRLESEQNLVQIVTIHKSKGLEYPVCFVPFISLVRSQNRRPEPLLYHDQERLIWDVLATDEGWEQQKQEVLAEDLRLLYVALTRPVYRCYVGIANQSRKLKAGISSHLYQTGIGYLLGIESKQCDSQQLIAATHTLNALDCICVETIAADAPIIQWQAPAASTTELSAKALTRQQRSQWRVGSYSGLVKHLPHEKVTPGADDEDFSQETNPMLVIDEIAEQPQFDRFSFERGANAGSFMHLVMELFDFTQADTELEPALIKAMQQYGFDQQVWLEPLKNWYQAILQAPLDQQLTLSSLPPSKVLVEMEFYLPLTELRADKLNLLLQQFGYQAGLSFDTLKGMLKGFIDLTFEHQGKFYIADYKSNHLGDKFSHYHGQAMQVAIDSHRYNLQYILYTLALHRYLKLRLNDYDYNSHFGGCYYLFLRGMSPAHNGSGVYFDCPPQALIEALDSLFSADMTADNPNEEATPC